MADLIRCQQPALSPDLPAGCKREQMGRPSQSSYYNAVAAPLQIQWPETPIQAPRVLPQSRGSGFVNELGCLSGNPPDEVDVMSHSVGGALFFSHAHHRALLFPFIRHK